MGWRWDGEAGPATVARGMTALVADPTGSGSRRGRGGEGAAAVTPEVELDLADPRMDESGEVGKVVLRAGWRSGRVFRRVTGAVAGGGVASVRGRRDRKSVV